MHKVGEYIAQEPTAQNTLKLRFINNIKTLQVKKTVCDVIFVILQFDWYNS